MPRKPKPVYDCDCGDHSWSPLSRGRVTYVSPQDRYLLEQQNWCFGGGAGYAMGWNIERQKTTFLHAEILQPPPGTTADHINKDRFDNRRHNLRPATLTQNNRNRRSYSMHGVRGVGRSSKNRWAARIRVKGKLCHLGCFDTKEEAAAAYDAAARRLHGEFAHLNKT